MANEVTQSVQATVSDKATRLVFHVDPLPGGPITAEVHIEQITTIAGVIVGRDDRANFRFEQAELMALSGAPQFQGALRDFIYARLAAMDAETAAAQIPVPAEPAAEPTENLNL